jgi:hypothetical protein
MRVNNGAWKVALPLVPALWAVVAQAQTPPPSASAEVAVSSPVSCAQFMAPRKTVKGKSVGQQECLMIDHGVVEPEKKYRRVDIGISGTLSGYIVKDGARQNYFTSVPDFTFTQFGNHQHPRFHGILKYEAAKGTSLTLTYPETGWNGKLFIMVHGRSGSFARGTQPSWDKYFDSKKPFDANKYERSMLARGYAVARSRRNADGFVPGDFSATLDDGTVWPDQNINAAPELILEKVRLVGNVLRERLGRKPTRNYWYGHSAGAYTALALIYMLQFDPQLNRDADGQETISGFIHDDPGGGLFLPMLERNSQDVLYRTAPQRSTFVKSLTLSHQNYPLVYSNVVVGEFDARHVPEGISDTALTNKRSMAKLFKQKELDGAFRMYEVRGISHFGDENMETNRSGDVQLVHLSRVMDGMIDLLDNWVEKGIEPPATKSDDPTVSAIPAINLPETACPLGHYYPFPGLRGNNSASAGFTSFAAYDGMTLEPMDGQLLYVDMNKNGRRDRRETVTEAWQRLGLLRQGESFDRAKFVACVQDAVAKLRADNVITEESAQLYVAEAGRLELPAR